MKLFLKINFILLGALVLWGSVQAAGLRSNKGRELYVPGEVLVRLKAGTSPDAGVKALSTAGNASGVNRTSFYKVKLAANTSVEQAVRTLQSDPSVLWAQPNYRYYAHCAEPTDSYYASPLTINGTEIHDSNNQTVTASWALLKIQAPAAWALFNTCPPGSTSVTVAVLDTGISKNHPDLAGINYAPGTNTAGVNSHGVDYSSTNTDDDFGHGTFVTGILAAQWNGSNTEICPPNNVVSGMAGLAPGITVMPVKVLDDTGSGSSESIATGTDWAVSNGAKVLNFSLGGPFTDQAEQDAVDNALANDCVVVASAGNDSGGPINFPAAYPPVVAVGATDNNDQVVFYSNVGPQLDLVAPGGAAAGGNFGDQAAQNILSAMLHCLNQASSDDFTLGPDPNFGCASGTSASAPYVTGTVALIRSMYPSLTNTQVVARLLNNTDSLNGNKGWDAKTGYGRLNVYRALYSAGALTPTPSPEITGYMTTFNSPNPYYPDSDGLTNITLAIDQAEAVELWIYDTSGEVVLHKNFSASELNSNPVNPQFKSFYVTWDGKNGGGQKAKNGIYFYTVKAGGKTARNKIALIQGSR